ncbi:MAG: hypothetical protein JNL28_04695 [Planctomycetes bacterium]|nr:hypothetical protein [Planctomycetota bacterium]
MKKLTRKQQTYAMCVKNRSHPASLEVRKVYRVLRDADAAKHGLVRVIDESDEDYLYPSSFFVLVELPRGARHLFRKQSK